MSYILEALRKSDQQRQRGTTPTLPMAQIVMAAHGQRLYMYYGLLAAVLLCVGISIGWLHPWHDEKSHNTKEASAFSLSQSTPQLDSAPQEPAVIDRTPQFTAVKIIPATQPAKNSAKHAIPSSSSVAQTSPPAQATPEKLVKAASEARVPFFDELPVAVQQEILPMTIQMHAYSGKPGERMVSINSRMLREGGYLNSDLRLEQVTPDGMVFSYKGYLFRRGVR